MNRRVVITGSGIVAPLGTTPETLWSQLVEGQSGVGLLSLFDAENFPVKVAAEVKDWSLWNVGVNPLQWSHCPRQTQFAVGAAYQAVRESGIEKLRMDPTRKGVYLGCGEAFEDFDQFTKTISQNLNGKEYDDQNFTNSALKIFSPDAEREYEPHMPVMHLAGLFDAQGPSGNCIAACVSSSQAIGESCRIIRRGEADIMLAGGAHSTIHPFGVTGFQRLSALSTYSEEPQKAVRPFDKNRQGFVIGEGAAILVLEELGSALRRNANILGEITGYGSSQDAYRITDSHVEARGTVSAITKSLRMARLNTDEIDYCNAHGTGTVVNDKVETLALKKVFGNDAVKLPVSSTKSMLGHATTACGAIELVICLQALRDGVIPPTINYETPDPECDLDYVPNFARQVKCKHILSNSIGFGGQNAALIVSRYEDSAAAAGITRKAA